MNVKLWESSWKTHSAAAQEEKGAELPRQRIKGRSGNSYSICRPVLQSCTLQEVNYTCESYNHSAIIYAPTESLLERLPTRDKYATF